MQQNVLIDKIVSKITVTYRRLTLVSNQDGFLAKDDVRSQIEGKGIIVVTGSQLNLRIHFELEYKTHPDQKYIYLCNNTDSILPDMLAEAETRTFGISELFPLFQDKHLLRRQSFEVLSVLFCNYAQKPVSLMEGKFIVEMLQRQEAESRKNSIIRFKEKLLEFQHRDWGEADAFIMALSETLAQAIDVGVEEDIEPQIDSLNQDFQGWVDSYYFAARHSNALLAPKCVNRILPHLVSNHSADEKVALVVVDGLSFWQYALLHQQLKDKGLTAENRSILSWLPSITLLSHQAIFLGDTPLQDYKQNPENEAKLWQGYWTQKGFAPFEIQYLSDANEFAINEGVKRLAYVTVEMDEKMHAVTDYKELYLLTNHWASHFLEKIKSLLETGFAVYLTTDHGSTQSHGWRTLSATEKVFLYKDGSRGARHLIYNNTNEQMLFAQKASKEISVLQHDNWLTIRDSHCFAKEYKTMLTHGGSHFMEVVIPWVKILK